MDGDRLQLRNRLLRLQSLPMPQIRTFVALAVSLLQLAPGAWSADVRELGAKGDGVADDTAAIQQAVATGSVYLPKGVYRITAPINVNLKETGRCAFTGDGTGRL